jgi:hypothetical protein
MYSIKKGDLVMKIKIIFFILFISLTSFVFGENVEVKKFGDFNYRIEHNGVVITKYKGTKTDVIIPEKIEGLPIVEIGLYAFAKSQLTSVIIPNSVKVISAHAFSFNDLTNITIPNSVATICDNAFAGNKLTNVKIPDSVETIHKSAFLYNRLPNSKNPFAVMTYKGEVTVIGYNHYMIVKANIVIPEKIDGLPVVAIGEEAFANPYLEGTPIYLKSVVIPKSVKIIGENAFDGNKLNNIVIPDSVTIIDKYAFRANGSTNVVISNSVKSIGDGAFAINNLTKVVIPNSIEIIGEFAFGENKLTEIIIPNSVKEIKRGAFARNNLTKVIIPNSVKKLDEKAFDDDVILIRQH